MNNTATSNTSNNTSIGFRSLKFTTINGEDNTAIGQGALENNADGDNNTAVGQGALNVNLGTSNTAVGQAAIRLHTAGNRNTAIGRSAIESVTDGEDATVLGYIAGRNYGSTFIDGNTVNTFSQGVMIGSNTRSLSNVSVNEIVIGYNAVGNGNNTMQLGNTSITKVNTSGSMNATKFVGKAGTVATTISSSDPSVSTLSLVGNDAAGVITFSTSGGVGAGNFITLTFGSAYETAPVVIIQAMQNGGSTASRLLDTNIYCMPSNTTTTTFIISATTPISTGLNYQIAYHVIGR